MPCAPARNNVSIPSYRGVEVRHPEALRADFHTPITRYRNIVAGGCAWQYLRLCWPYPRAKSKSDQSLRKRVQPLSPFALGPMGKQEIS